MMQLASTHPTQSPSTPLNPAQPLGVVTLQRADGSKTPIVFYPATTGYEEPSTAFVPASGYKDALSLARSFATDIEGYPAQGVVQAADGAYYVTALRTRPNDRGAEVNIDGESFDYDHFTSVAGAHRYTPALQAIVGGERTLDLRTDRADNPIGKSVVVDPSGRVIAVQG